MPVYNTLNPPPSLHLGYPMSQFTVWSAEALTVGKGSQQVMVAPSLTGSRRAIRVEIDFSANPGNVTINILESDSDVLGLAGYDQVPVGGVVTQANLITGPNGASTRLAIDLDPFTGQFCCLYTSVAPSNGGITATARITRAA